MTSHAEPTIEQVEAALRGRLRVEPPRDLASTIDGRVERALRATPVAIRRRVRRVPLALAAALVLAAFATGAVFAEPIRQATITVINGIRFSDDVRS